MIRAHLNVNEVYVECHATKRACPRKDHKEFKNLNEMNDYNEKLIERDSDDKKLLKVSAQKAARMDSIRKQTKLEISALERIYDLQNSDLDKLNKERTEFEKKADRTMRMAFKNLEPSMESAYNDAREAQSRMNIMRNKSLPLTLDEVSYGMKKIAPHGLKMSDFLDKDSIAQVKINGSESAAKAIDRKIPYSEISITPDGDDSIRVEASTRDSDGTSFTVSGVMPPEKYVDGVGKNFGSTYRDYAFITNRGIKTGKNSNESSWPEGIRDRIDYTSDIIKRNGLTNTDFPTVIMNTGKDSNRLIVDELELDRRRNEICKDNQQDELRRLGYLEIAAKNVKDGYSKDIPSAIKDMNERNSAWTKPVFHMKTNGDDYEPIIENWLHDHGIDE